MAIALGSNFQLGHGRAKRGRVLLVYVCIRAQRLNSRSFYAKSHIWNVKIFLKKTVALFLVFWYSIREGNTGIMTVMSTLSHSPTMGADITGKSVFDWRVSYILPEFSKPFSFRVRASSISISPDVETCNRLVRDILCGRVPVD